MTDTDAPAASSADLMYASLRATLPASDFPLAPRARTAAMLGIVTGAISFIVWIPALFLTGILNALVVSKTASSLARDGTSPWLDLLLILAMAGVGLLLVFFAARLATPARGGKTAGALLDLGRVRGTAALLMILHIIKVFFIEASSNPRMSPLFPRSAAAGSGHLFLESITAGGAALCAAVLLLAARARL